MNIDLHISFDSCVDREHCEELITVGLNGDPAFNNRSSGDQESAICVIPESGQDLFAQLKNTHKGNVLREIKKSEDRGFTSQRFNYFNHIEDIVEIHRSKTERGGKKISGFYSANRSKFGPKISKFLPDEQQVCVFHNLTYWGLFESEEISNTSTLKQNEKLIGYIRTFRMNDVVWYNMIMGHGDYLKFGVMHKMHTDFLNHLITSSSPPLYVNYGAGEVEKNVWKRKALFKNVKVRFDDLKIYNSNFSESDRARLQDEIPKLLSTGDYAHAEIVVRLLRYYPAIDFKSRIIRKLTRILRS